MTAVAAVLVDGQPSLVGDVVLTVDGQRVDCAGKVYVLAPNVALGWSGNLSLAELAIRRIRKGLGGERASSDDLRRVLDDLEDLRERDSARLELTGWIVVSAVPKVVRWASHYTPVLFSDSENSIGDGGTELRRMLADPEFATGKSEGHDTVPLKLISRFLEARAEETRRGVEWPQTWGAAYDAITYQEGYFRWLEKLTYVGWDVHIDRGDRIESVEQAPVVITQERVHACTVVLTKQLGASHHDVQVSYPIDAELDLGMYRRRPYSAASYYYAPYFRVFVPQTPIPLPLYFGVKQTTPSGVMHHPGPDDGDPHFQVNRDVLQPLVTEMLEKVRAARRR